MAEQRQPRITPEAALTELGAAGSVAGLAQGAMLGFAGSLAAAKAVRLKREALRVGAKFGATAPQTQAALSRVDVHASFQTALKTEQERVAVPIPALDAAAGIVYGRVLTSDGLPAAGRIVEALAVPDGQSLGKAAADARGAYALSLPMKANTALHLVSKGETSADSGPIVLAPGMRAYRDIVLPPPPAVAAPPPPPAAAPMPDLVGLTELRARAALDRLKVTRISTTQEVGDAPAGQVTRQTPAPGTLVKFDSTVELVVSAGKAIAVPDLKGTTVQQATVTLNGVGLKIGQITGDPAQGKVTAQQPAAGTKVAMGTTVDVTVAKPG